ncbi:hypothetical protein OIU77_013689 [Salix suchowensis]|uniref:Uncharacterized protein n=1 Tax=Salix suchowensis TaxID=1278906 RepID=A0ABQ8ZUP1_9ROSI|nr:hypothetical protein OIU77_013689 [Salix suchowensis]
MECWPNRSPHLGRLLLLSLFTHTRLQDSEPNQTRPKRLTSLLTHKTHTCAPYYSKLHVCCNTPGCTRSKSTQMARTKPGTDLPTSLERLLSQTEGQCNRDISDVDGDFDFDLKSDGCD